MPAELYVEAVRGWSGESADAGFMLAAFAGVGIRTAYLWLALPLRAGTGLVG